MGAPPPLSVVLKDASEPLCVRRISPPQAGSALAAAPSDAQALACLVDWSAHGRVRAFMGRANAGLLDSWPGRTGEAEGADRRHRRLGAAPLSPLPLSDVWHFLRPRDPRLPRP